MTITNGSRVPTATLKRIGDNGMEDVDFGSYIKGRSVIIFGTPGAFTPSCAQKHLPGYVMNADAIKKAGVDEIICLSVNDPFVMKQWGESANAAGKVTMMPDWNAQLCDAMGLTFDASGAGLGKRAKRFSMLVTDGVVSDLQVEEVASEVELTGAEACMVRLGKRAA
jgi:glutaredoxin/glutathione-dependent peroxiredoxin